MKRNIHTLVSISIALIIIISGCSKGKDASPGDRGGSDGNDKPANVTRADSIITHGGKGRIEITWLLESDSNVYSYKVNWYRNNQTNFVENQINKVHGRNIIDLMVDGLEEGSYYFEIRMYDKEGNASAKSTATGVAYGPKYQSSLPEPALRSINRSGDDVEVNFEPAGKGLVREEVKYKDVNGDSVVQFVPKAGVPYTLKGIPADEPFKYRSVYLPDPTAIDTFYTDYLIAQASEFDLYLLIGQSNMSGRAAITPTERDTLKNVYLFTGNGWEPAANPMNKYSTVRKDLSGQKLGPGYSFAKKVEERTGRKIGLIVNARGGTALEWWEKGYAGSNDYDLYEEAIVQAKEAEKYGHLKGILWLQGSANKNRADGYMTLLKELVGDLRKDLGTPVYFIAGEIGKWRSSNIEINQVIRTVPSEIENADYASADGLTPLEGDSTNPHFDTRSQLILGERYADKVLEKIY